MSQIICEKDVKFPSDHRQKCLKVAKLYVYDAIWGDGTEFCMDSRSLICYQIYRNQWYQTFLGLISFCFLLVPFIDEACRYSNVTYVAWIYDISLFIFILGHYFLFWHFTGFRKLRSTRMFWFTICATCLYPGDILLRWNLQGYEYLKWGDILRVILFTCSIQRRQIRMAVTSVGHLWQLGLTAVLMYLLTKLIFGTILWQIFKDKNVFLANGRPYMQTLDDAVWHLVIFSTTVNSPDVMLPALSRTQIYLIIFMISFAVDVILPLIGFAFAMDSFDNQLQKEAERLKQEKRELLKMAFELLSQRGGPRGDQFVISRDVWNEFMDIFMTDCYIAQKDLYFFFLAKSHDDYITEDEFQKLPDLMLLKVKIKLIRYRFLERWLPFYNRGISLFIRRCILSSVFDYLLYIVIISNVVIFILLPHHYDFYFLGFYSMELLLRCYSMGIGPYFRSHWNKFDMLIVIAAFVITLIVKHDDTWDGVQILVLVLRMARLARLLRKIPRVNYVFGALFYVWPGVKTYLTLIWIYIILSISFCVKIYHHELDVPPWNQTSKTDCGNSILFDTDFGNLRYCLMNFNSYTESLNTLAALIVANNWQIISQGYEDMTIVWPTRILFLIIVLLFKLMITCLFARLIAVIKLYVQTSSEPLHSELTRFTRKLGLLYYKRTPMAYEEDALDKDARGLPLEVTGYRCPSWCTTCFRKALHQISDDIKMDETDFIQQEAPKRKSTIVMEKEIRNPEGVLFKVSKSKRRTEEMILERSVMAQA